METLSDLIERLSIINNKIFHLESKIRKSNYDPKITTECKKKIDQLNMERWIVKSEIDRLIADLVTGKKTPYVKEEVKLYGDIQ